MENDFVISIGERNLCAWRGSGGLDTKECIQGVSDSLDLLDLEVLNGTKVEDGAICGADLEETKERDWSVRGLRGE